MTDTYDEYICTKLNRNFSSKVYIVKQNYDDYLEGTRHQMQGMLMLQPWSNKNIQQMAKMRGNTGTSGSLQKMLLTG